MKKLFYITLTIMMCAVSWPALSGGSAGLTRNEAPMLITYIGAGSGDIDIGAGSGGYVATVNTDVRIRTSHFAVVGALDRSWSSTVTFEPKATTGAFRIEDPGRDIRP